MSSFINTISRLNKEGCIPELDAALAALTQQVRVTGKPGSLTFTLKLKPMNADGSLVDVTDSITVKAPIIPRRSHAFYTTDEGTLQRNDPNQTELPLTLLEGGQTEEKETAPKSAQA